jgi:hypothetical protein
MLLPFCTVTETASLVGFHLSGRADWPEDNSECRFMISAHSKTVMLITFRYDSIKATEITLQFAEH